MGRGCLSPNLFFPKGEKGYDEPSVPKALKQNLMIERRRNAP
ncbi:hypothetical protein HMPREF3034_02163 [Prevotella sp. DNF00663]|nr:hypothetical protein HMPREF3034_02163 [Prevotella sp. DNF00663]